jgi:cell division transport system permease protein
MKKRVDIRMKISTFFYTLRQGFRNIFRNKWFSLASIATIGACLFLLALFYAVLANFEHVVKTAEEGVSVTVFFDDGLEESRILEIGDMISKRVEVSNVNYISADAAWESFRDEYIGDAAVVFTDNPLEDSANYEIYLTDISMQGALVNYLESIEGVREVNRSEVTATALSGINMLITYVSGGIIIILLAVSIFLISNTVTIGISIRKEEIQIMKYIGATDFFVRAPFVIEGILIGLIGAAIPLTIVYFLYAEAITYIGERFEMLTQLLNFLPVQTIFDVLIPLCLGLGMGIGFLGSFSTVRKHLSV